MTDEQRKMLTEFIGECWHDLQWSDNQGSLCTKCHENIDWMSNYQRTFLAWPDLGACMEALVRKGNWFGFWTFTHRIFHTERQKESSRRIQDWDFDAWLFRLVNEAGEAHFAKLCVDFLEIEMSG